MRTSRSRAARRNRAAHFTGGLHGEAHVDAGPRRRRAVRPAWRARRSIASGAVRSTWLTARAAGAVEARSRLVAAMQRDHARGEVEVLDTSQGPRPPSSPSASPGRDACGSTRRGSGRRPRRPRRSLPSARQHRERIRVVGALRAASTACENSSTSTRPPGRATRAISASARSLCVMLRRPKATETQSKVSEANGSFSASHSASGAKTPASISLSRPTREHRRVDVGHPHLARGPGALGEGRARGRRCPRPRRARVEPSRTPLISMAKRFHARCSPSDMRSFIRS